MKPDKQPRLSTLLTYIWIILILFVAVIALAYFRVINFDAIFPKTCELKPDLKCNAKISPQIAEITIENDLTKTITIVEIILGNCKGLTKQELKSSEKAAFKLDCSTGAKGTDFISNLHVSYKLINEEMPYNSTGIIRTKIS